MPEAPGVPALIKTPVQPPEPPFPESASMTITPYLPCELPSSENPPLTESTVLPHEALFPEDQSTDAPDLLPQLLPHVERKARLTAATIARGNLKQAPPPSEIDPGSALSIKIPRKMKGHDRVNASALLKVNYEHRANVYKWTGADEITRFSEDLSKAFRNVMHQLTEALTAGVAEFPLDCFQKWDKDLQLWNFMNTKIRDHEQWKYQVIILYPQAECFTNPKHYQGSTSAKLKVYIEIVKGLLSCSICGE